jgi:hypothetical protein
MKHVLLVLACLIIPSIVLSAPADSSAVENTRPNSLHAGAWALEFSFAGGFYDTELTAKRHWTSQSALRLGFSISTDSRSQAFAADTTVTVRSQSYDSDDLTTRVTLVFQHYPNLSAPAQFYFGVGPFVGYSRHTENGERMDSDPFYGYTDHYTREDNTWSGGATFLIGAEWFVSRALSMSAEYNIDGGYRKGEATRTTEREGAGAPLRETDDWSEWFLQTGNARFGLGFYF